MSFELHTQDARQPGHAVHRAHPHRPQTQGHARRSARQFVLVHFTRGCWPHIVII